MTVQLIETGLLMFWSRSYVSNPAYVYIGHAIGTFRSYWGRGARMAYVRDFTTPKITSIYEIHIV